MWLLSTDRAELHSFASPEAVSEGYATLSHCWGEDEKIFQDVREITRRCEGTGKNPRDFMSEKIRRTCEIAESHGYKWVWIDTCCIDKTSSAELSESINSMFRFYALCEVCYTYLHDVHWEPALKTKSIFRSCKWITRGWTLQELLAPTVVVFMDSSWRMLGMKGDFAEALSDSTRIPIEVLRHQMELEDFSVAERMSWASRRETTRVEDQAYSLLGIFDINMPTLYGEGPNAFLRLQEEILKRSPDTTLFAWGQIIDFPTLPFYHPDYIQPIPKAVSVVGATATMATALPEPIPVMDLSFQQSMENYTRSGLFAQSPSEFVHCHGIKHRPYSTKDMPQPVPDEVAFQVSIFARVPTFTVTPHGILSEIPIVSLQGRVFADLFWDDESSVQQQTHLLLPLIREKGSDPARPLYYAGLQNVVPDQDDTETAPEAFRMVRISLPEYMGHLEMSTAESTWETVYLANRTICPGLSAWRMSSNNSISSPLRISQCTINKLLDAIPGMFVMSTEDMESLTPWATSSSPTVVTFTSGLLTFHLLIGQCTHSGDRSSDRAKDLRSEGASHHKQSTIWVTLRQDNGWFGVGETSPALMNKHKHTCSRDHVSEWRGLKKTFTLDASEPMIGRDNSTITRLLLTLSFSPSLMTPKRTLDLRFDTVVQKVKKSTNTSQAVRAPPAVFSAPPASLPGLPYNSLPPTLIPNFTYGPPPGYFVDTRASPDPMGGDYVVYV